MKKFSYDPACEELADHFMSDIPTLERTSERRQSLAQAIQDAVENWFFTEFPSERSP